MSERGAGALEEPALALRAPQRIGTDHPDAVRVHRAQPLPEAFQTAQSAFRGGIVQAPAVAQPRGETHHLAQPVQYDKLAVRIARDHHVKTIGA